MKEQEAKDIVIKIIHIISFLLISIFIVFVYTFGHWVGENKAIEKIKKNVEHSEKTYKRDIQ